MLGTSAVSTNVCRSNNIATRGQQHLILLAIVEGWLKLVDSTHTKKTKSLKDTKRLNCLNLVIPPSKASFPAKENNKQSVSEMEKRTERGRRRKDVVWRNVGAHTRYQVVTRTSTEPFGSRRPAIRSAHTHTVLHTVEKKKRGAREDKSNPLEGAVLYTKREWYCWFLISAI